MSEMPKNRQEAQELAQEHRANAKAAETGSIEYVANTLAAEAFENLAEALPEAEQPGEESADQE